MRVAFAALAVVLAACAGTPQKPVASAPTPPAGKENRCRSNGDVDPTPPPPGPCVWHPPSYLQPGKATGELLQIGNASFLIRPKSPPTGEADEQRREATSRAEQVCNSMSGRLIVLPPETNRTPMVAVLVFTCDFGPHQRRHAGTSGGFQPAARNCICTARGLVFPGEPSAQGERGPIDADKLLRHILRRALRRAGLPPLRFHDLRHMAGT